MKPVLRTIAISFALSAVLLRLEVLPSAWGEGVRAEVAPPATS